MRRERGCEEDSPALEWLCALLIALSWMAMVALVGMERDAPATSADSSATQGEGRDLAETLSLYVVDVRIVAAGWPSS
jgi:hypothetical protein